MREENSPLQPVGARLLKQHMGLDQAYCIHALGSHLPPSHDINLASPLALDSPPASSGPMKP